MDELTTDPDLLDGRRITVLGYEDQVMTREANGSVHKLVLVERMFAETYAVNSRYLNQVHKLHLKFSFSDSTNRARTVEVGVEWMSRTSSSKFDIFELF